MYKVGCVVWCTFHSRSLEDDNSKLLSRTVLQRMVLQADHVYRNGNNELKLTDGEENDQHSLKPLQIQSGDSQHVTVQQRFLEFTVLIRYWTSGWRDQKKYQKRRWPKKVTLLDALKGPCVARKYECPSDIKDNTIIRCNTLEN
jgi:hypothetical protein